MPRRLQRDWLTTFLECYEDTEVPREWLKWAGIAALSGTLKNHVHIWWKRVQIYPNQYIILVGPPGKGKGEAVKAYLDMCDESGCVNLIEDSNTPQEIFERISIGFSKITLSRSVGHGPIMGSINPDRSVCLLNKEFAALLRNFEKYYDSLCEFWDQTKYTYRTKNNGKFLLEEICVSILAGCTVDTIRELNSDTMKAVASGLTARCIFVYASDKYKLIPDLFGKPSVQILKAVDNLANDLQHISTLTGEMHLTSEALKYWNSKYGQHNRKGDFNTDVAENFKSRISSHILKTALALSVSENDSLSVTRDQLERATGYVEEVRDKIDIVFRSVGESPLAVGQDIALQFIQAKGITSFREIMGKCHRHFTDEQLRQILTVLEYAGLIKTDQGYSIIEDTNKVQLVRN